MKRLSRTLGQKGPTTNAHADLQYGKPPLSDFSFLTEQSVDHHVETTPRPDSAAKTNVSDDTLSTFSCVGDFLPDETADINLVQMAGTDNEVVAVRRIANFLAKRRLEGHVATEKEGSSSSPIGLGEYKKTIMNNVQEDEKADRASKARSWILAYLTLLTETTSQEFSFRIPPRRHRSEHIRLAI